MSEVFEEKYKGGLAGEKVEANIEVKKITKVIQEVHNVFDAIAFIYSDKGQDCSHIAYDKNAIILDITL